MAGSLISTFVEAFKRAAGKSQIDTKELARSQGGSLGSTTSLRPASQPDNERGITGDRPMASFDPDEGRRGPERVNLRAIC